ncbi:5-formyltetrahydrofolate cyclo-ligase [Nocardioides limicola]|uniref:5-formyltetrahydrofolate cyclo-ligase n=1 Tax=Nocardioides limicola TaxID=2803368 RepID=UPI0027DB3FE2|nr:5-formyltetrahydrofolate cyclo-ligase [Nocardioides sp. DJM-14]
MTSAQHPPSPDIPGGPTAAKQALRRRLLDQRRQMGVAQRRQGNDSLAAALLAAEEVRRAAQVAAYVPVGGEPGSLDLLAALTTPSRRVLLPVLLPDDDLDWAEFTGLASLARTGRGLWEPTGPRLGPGAVAAAEVVLAPGLAVDRTGARLGRGGGSYDRTLARVTGWTCLLLWEHEVLDEVPTEPHDLAVAAVATPSGVQRFG